MRAYKITFCLGETYQKEQSQEKTFKIETLKKALEALYISFWGTPVFVFAIKEVCII